MKLLILGVLSVCVQGEYPIQYCDSDLVQKFRQCYDSVPISTDTTYSGSQTLRSLSGHLSICYGDWPACNEIQKIAITDAGACHVAVWRSYEPKLNELFTPCENPLPPRLVEKQFCAVNGLILSEYYGKLYTDEKRNNLNEHFTYNQTGRVLIAKSNGQCVEGIPPPEDPTTRFYFTGVKTAPCDFNNILQRWDLVDNAIKSPSGYSFKVDPNTRGALVLGGGIFPSDATFLSDCNAETAINVHIMSTRGKRISEFYSGLYFDSPKDNLNEKFIWDRKNLMFKSASANQCLDSYLDSDGKYKVHTYQCDVNNPNQKWNVHADSKQIEHGTHTGQCLDGDPTYPDHHLQMWECVANNPNQQWDVVSIP